MKDVVLKEMRSRTVNAPTPTALKIARSILGVMVEDDVNPEEVLFVLGESIVNVLIPLAEPLGYDKEEIVRIFGEGLCSSKIEFKAIKEELS